MNEVELRKIFEANMSELFDLKLEKLSRESELYSQVKYSYKNGDLEKLKGLNTYIQKGNYSSELKLITQIRSGIRLKQFAIKMWLTKAQNISEDNIWKGEILFSIAYSLDMTQKYYESNKVYIEAYKLLLIKNCREKALMALHNAISVIANHYPDKRQFSDYQMLLKKAKEQNSLKVAALANLNLSIEYQKIGATITALERIECAIKDFEQVEMESAQYFIALAQKADLLVDIEKYSEALLLLEKIGTSSHEYAKAAAYNIKQKIQKKQNSDYAEEKTATGIIFSPTFIQRRQANKKNIDKIKLGKMESRLIDFLSSGPKDKISIIKYLYGEDIDYFSLEGRFKSLLSRIRKKIPFSINFHDGVYSLEGEFSEFKRHDKKSS